MKSSSATFPTAGLKSLKVFYVESMPFNKSTNIFENMQIEEQIKKSVVKPCTNIEAYFNHYGHIITSRG